MVRALALALLAKPALAQAHRLVEIQLLVSVLARCAL